MHPYILAHLTKAIPVHLSDKFRRCMCGDPQHNKPDLVIIGPDQKTAFVIDVTMPFEGDESMTNARSLKLDK